MANKFSFDLGGYTVVVHSVLYSPPDYNTDISQDDYQGGWDIEWDLLDEDGQLVTKISDDFFDEIECEIVELLT